MCLRERERQIYRKHSGEEREEKQGARHDKGLYPRTFVARFQDPRIMA